MDAVKNGTWAGFCVEGPYDFDQKTFDICIFGTTLPYALLVVASLLSLYRTHKRFSVASWKLGFHISLQIGCIVRVLFLVFQVIIAEEICYILVSFNMIMDTLPAFLFLTSYMIFLKTWTEMVFSNVPSRFIVPFVFINSTLYTLLMTMGVLDTFRAARDHIYATPGDDQDAKSAGAYETTVQAVTAVMYILVSVTFLYYGYVMYTLQQPALRPFKPPSTTVRNLKIVGPISLCCMVIFAVRSALLIVLLFWPKMFEAPYSDMMYYLFTEAFPLVLMLYVLDRESTEETIPLIVTEPSPSSSRPDVN